MLQQGHDYQGGFAFDKIFGMNTKQKDVFDYSIRSIVDGMLTLAYASGS
jgi:kinesin family protein 5